MQPSSVAVSPDAALTERMSSVRSPRREVRWLSVLGHTAVGAAALVAGFQCGLRVYEWRISRAAAATRPALEVARAESSRPSAPPVAASFPMSPQAALPTPSAPVVVVTTHPPPAPRPKQTRRVLQLALGALPAVPPTRVHLVLSRPLHMGLVEGALSGPLLSEGMTVLPAGTTVRGAAAELDSGRFVVRFDEVRFRDGSSAAVDGAAWVSPRAGEEHPELDLALRIPGDQ